MEKYQPEVIDTSDIELPDEINSAIEQLAENIHKSWAKQRIADGWVYGEERNDIRKTHPSLVPYNQLSESEKEYDRITVRETLKSILKMGYKIIK